VLTHRAMCGSVYCRSKTDKRILYVGGLDEDVDLAVLRAAFIPFGEVIYLQKFLTLAPNKGLHHPSL
jgi:hypothetical protein